MQDIASLASPYSFSQETSGELIVLAVVELLVQVNVSLAMLTLTALGSKERLPRGITLACRSLPPRLPYGDKLDM